MKKDRMPTVIEEIRDYLLQVLDRKLVENIMSRLGIKMEIDKRVYFIEELKRIKLSRE